jgi:hypothetical protein
MRAGVSTSRQAGRPAAKPPAVRYYATERIQAEKASMLDCCG